MRKICKNLGIGDQGLIEFAKILTPETIFFFFN